MKKVGFIRILLCLLSAMMAIACQVIDIGDENPLVAPSNFLAAIDGTDSLAVNLEWTAASGVTYTVYWRKGADSLTVDNATGSHAGININQYKVTGLDAGYLYAFAVVAVSGSESSELSDVKTVNVAGPTLNPPSLGLSGGTYLGDQSVTLTHDNPSAVIVYALNSDPLTRSSTVYSPATPISIAGTTTVKAMAYIPAWNSSKDSTVASATYKIADAYVLRKTGAGTFIDVAKNGSTLSGYSHSSDGLRFYMDMDGNDIYVAHVNAGALGFWKNNGSFVTVDSGASYVLKDIYVDAGIVYLSGSQDNAATYWKYDPAGPTITEVPLSGTSPSCANAVMVNGGTVYCAGYYKYALTGGMGDGNRAAFWVGTTLQAIGPTAWPPSQATTITNNATYLLVGGDVNGYALYWQALVSTPSTYTQHDINYSGQTSNIVAATYLDGIWYAAGARSGSSFLWTITPGASPNIDGMVVRDKGADYLQTFGLCVLSAQNIYVAGSSTAVSPNACYWRFDGLTFTQVAAGGEEAYDIFVVERP